MGKTLAEIALNKGERVVATSRTLPSLSSFPSLEPPSSPPEPTPASRLLTLQLDVTNPTSISHAFSEAKRAFGRIDVVVSNAGFALFGEVEGTPDGTARAMFETNFWGAANVAREAVRSWDWLRGAGNGTLSLRT